MMIERVDLTGFDDLWKSVEELHILPNTAIMHIPDLLSDKTKRKMMKKTPQEVAGLVKAAIEEIENHGSVEVLDVQIKKELMKRK